MKIAVTPLSITSIRELSDAGADIFILGNDKLANRLANSFSNDEISEANVLIKSLDKEIYISLNLIVHNFDLESVSEFLSFVMELNVDGIIFGDLSVYMMAKRMGLKNKLIYNPETLNTSYYDPIYWRKKGIKGITISKEITLEDISEISKTSDIEISLVGHGHLNMFHSRRPLIENYFQHTESKYNEFKENRNLKLIEEIRNEAYPIFQDSHGTHIFRDKALESYQEANTLSKTLNVFIIDGIFKSTSYLIETISNYKNILCNNNLLLAKEISKQYEKDHDSGFLYKKTVYVKY